MAASCRTSSAVTTPSASEGDPLDLEFTIEGAEALVDPYTGCAAGAGVELWSVVGGSHIPVFDDFIGGRLMVWLLAQPKP